LPGNLEPETVRMTRTRHMIRTALAAAAPALVVLIAAQAQAAGRIAVREKSEVAGRVVLVGDVAQITGVPDEERLNIEGLKFSTSPPPDKDLSLTREQVTGKLLNAGLKLENFDVSIPETTVIHRKSVTITGTRLMEEGIAYLRSTLPWKSITVEPSEKDIPRDVVLPYGEASLEFEMTAKPKEYGINNFRVKIFLDGEPARVIGMTGYVKVLGDVVTAARNIKSGQTITEDDLAIEKLDVARLRPGAYNSMEKLLGKQALRNISRGDLFTHSSIESIPDINVGDMVSLIYKKPGLEISARAKALQKGYIGESIKVVTTEPKKTLTGVVVDPQTVEIVEP